MIYLGMFFLALIVAWLGYNFVLGFIEGFRKGSQSRRRRRKDICRLWEMSNRDKDL
jgi:hypothetical protein